DATILILKYFYRRKSKDIARLVHMTPIAVRVRLNRALKKLRQLLTNEEMLR
ncbi:MAG: sigma-70 family RNA polymerase sigma factor, partial [Oscillospiraceae bacterium]|nr:sigma-70 family RNA polymerase sigma factor [Oscillospiraceae bacterium]